MKIIRFFKYLLKRIKMLFKKPIKLTRQQRRAIKIKIDGKRMSIVQYLRSVSTTLPAMHHRDGGKKVDHHLILKRQYQIKGLKGVNAYVKAITDLARKEASVWASKG